MSDLSISKHFQRVLRFLISLSNDEVAALLARRGFDKEEAERGWQLFSTAAGRYISFDRGLLVASSPAKERLAELDNWENLHFDIADASLVTNFPSVHQALFLNLGKTSGQAVVITVTTLLDRLDAMETAGGADNEAALALLAKRGLTPAERARARALLAEVAKLAVPDPNVLTEPTARQQREAAQEQMWQWFQEWSTLARTVVGNKRLRIYMGISKPAQSAYSDGDADADADIDADIDPIVAPTPATPSPMSDPNGPN